MKGVPRFRLLWLAAQPVSVTLGTQEQVVERVLSVLSTSTKLDWALVLALRVWLTRSPELVVSQTQPVSATRDSPVLMVARASSALVDSMLQPFSTAC